MKYFSTAITGYAIVFLLLLTNNTSAQVPSRFNEYKKVQTKEEKAWADENNRKYWEEKNKKNPPKPTPDPVKKEDAPVTVPTGKTNGTLQGTSSIYQGKYSYISPNKQNGMQSVALNHRWGFIDESWRETIPAMYDEAYASIDTKGFFYVRLGNKWWFIDNNNKQTIPVFYENVVTGFNGGKATVEKDGRKFDINEKGEVVKEYPDLTPTKGFDNFVDPTDGSNIATIKIGKQVWTLKNLSQVKFRNGDNITEAKTREEWKKASEQKKSAWCYYDFDSSNGVKYGKMYNWFALNDPRGLAPVGFHIPSKNEWAKLIKSIGDDESGIKMRSVTGWPDCNQIEGTNESGFSALPGGMQIATATYNAGKVYQTGWWSSDEVDAEKGWCRYLPCSSKLTYASPALSKGDGLSVRCIKD